MTPRIGERLEGRGSIALDIEKLVETRMLIQANSGGGKSHAIRRILEITYGRIPHIVLDIEGEFKSLREKFDYVLAGQDADIQANLKTAELLARKILELRASIIIDLYELKYRDRIKFVRLFLESLINAPKDLWNPTLVVIDEAHSFCPEKDEAESSAAVIDLATKGRKRGFAAILATQRLSKLHKDAAAEMMNKLIGRTVLDIDMKRAGDELGFVKKDYLKLRSLHPGEFYCFGPAFNTEGVETVKVGPVETTHPKVGHRQNLRNPVPTAKVKSILTKLTDLPKEVEKEANEVLNLQSQVQKLQVELRQAKGVEKVKIGSAKDDYERGRQEGLEMAKPDKALLRRLAQECFEDGFNQCKNLAQTRLRDILVKFRFDDKTPRWEPPAVKEGHTDSSAWAALESKGSSTRETLKKSRGVVTEIKDMLPAVKSDPVTSSNNSWGRCERMILQFLAMRVDTWFEPFQVGAMTGYASGSGSFLNAISRLFQAGLVVKAQGRVGVSRDTIPNIKGILGDDFRESNKFSLEDWLNKLGNKCERNVYKFLLDYPGPRSKQQIAQYTQYAEGSGSFNNAISRLNTLGLIQKNNDGTIQIHEAVINL